MPLYDCRCDSCKKELEVVRGINEHMPDCCGVQMKRLPSAPSIITVFDSGKTRTYSKGYKESYAKQYRQSIGVDS